ncbi:ras-related protein Rab-31 isoform X2 [Tyto alba]|uniref:ras-related protein Rab-31 isoform X2 n=1 Tax=Tyto alba TaxID=56313 RepID=UPI001C66D296|nr:ras-related protein Rab-31 isoform X2 [Tyto alba]
MMAIRELKDTGVGKSSIVCRFVQDHFDHNISPTIGASFMTKTVPCGNELHKFLIWDTAGQERFHSLAPMYYRGSAAAVIVYDITKQDSFHTLKKWVKELKEHGPENIVMAIAGNKCDLSDIREVPVKDAKEYAESIGAIVVETSAKNAVNIEELFQGISRQIPPLDPHENGNNGAIKLGKQTSQTGGSRCLRKSTRLESSSHHSQRPWLSDTSPHLTANHTPVKDAHHGRKLHPLLCDSHKVQGLKQLSD